CISRGRTGLAPYASDTCGSRSFAMDSGTIRSLLFDPGIVLESFGNSLVGQLKILVQIESQHRPNHGSPYQLLFRRICQIHDQCALMILIGNHLATTGWHPITVVIVIGSHLIVIEARIETCIARVAAWIEVWRLVSTLDTLLVLHAEKNVYQQVRAVFHSDLPEPLSGKLPVNHLSDSPPQG